MEVAAPSVTADAVIAGSVQQISPPLVVATLGDSLPRRRNMANGEPYLSFDCGPGAAPQEANLTATLALALPVATLNAGAVAVERITGRPLYSLRVGVRSFGGEAARPFAVYDISAGRVTLNARVAAAILSLPAEAHNAVQRFSSGIFDATAKQLGPAREQDGNSYAAGRAAGAAGLIATAAAAAAAAALATAVPLWFCIACPVVLGLLAPLVLNAGCAAAAEAACKHYKLPDEDCATLWYGAFAVAMVLSLASAIPIVYVCRLPECGRQALA
ncbi:hypothetical protein WJX81_004405 [Elliptochloris bilobata]|uniref:Uncharacterized protein n=1 Tax=Elliptochloris bilobata TaxID=381761 RepID=A0AAW1RH82_9CHLO